MPEERERPQSGWEPPAQPWSAPGQQPPADGAVGPGAGQPAPDGGQQWPAPGQQPPSGGGQWSAPGQQPPSGPPPTAADQSDVTVPAWLGTDWLLALRIVLIGLLLLLLAGVVLTLVDVLRLTAGPGLSAVDWTGVAVGPLVVVLGWAGGAAGAPLLATGVIYAFLAYRWAARRAASRFDETVQDRARLFALAPKIGVLAAAVLLTAGILLNGFGESLVFRTSGVFGVFGAVDLTSLVFFTLFVGSLTGLFATLSATSTPLTEALGVRGSMPALVRSGSVGGRRVLLVGGLSLLVLATLGSLLDSMSQSGTGLGQVVSLLLWHVVDILYRGIDRAVLLLVGTTKFLHEGGFVWSGIGGTSAWMWFSIPILLGAYVAGGMLAARSARPSTQVGAAKAALLVGPAVALIASLVAIGWAGQPGINDIVPIALLLPSLWGVVAVGGAWLWANQQGLPSGTTARPPASASGAPGTVVPPTGTQGAHPPPAGGQGWATPSGAQGWSSPPAGGLGSEPTRSWSGPPPAPDAWAPPSGGSGSAGTGGQSPQAQGPPEQAGSDAASTDRSASDEGAAPSGVSQPWGPPSGTPVMQPPGDGPTGASSGQVVEETPTADHGAPASGAWPAPSGAPVESGAWPAPSGAPVDPGAGSPPPASWPQPAEPPAEQPAEQQVTPPPAPSQQADQHWPAPPAAPQAPAAWPSPPAAPQAPADDTIDLGALPPPDPTRRSRD
jgi:hypothetical protein